MSASQDVSLQGTLRVFLEDGRDVGHVHAEAEGWSATLRIQEPTCMMRAVERGLPSPEAAIEWMLSHPSLHGDLTSLPGARRLGDGIVLVFWHDGGRDRLALLDKRYRWGLTTGNRLRTRRSVRVVLLRETDAGRDTIEAGLSHESDGWRIHRPNKGDLGPWPGPAAAFEALAKALARETESAHARLALRTAAAAWTAGLQKALADEADPAAAGVAPPKARLLPATFRVTRSDDAAIGTIAGAPGRWTATAEAPVQDKTTPPTRTFATIPEAVAHLLTNPRLAFDPRAHGARHLRGLLCLPLGGSERVGAVLRPHLAARQFGLRRKGRILALAWRPETPTSLPDALVIADPDGRLRLCGGIHDRGRRLKDGQAAAEALAAVAGGDTRHAALDLARLAEAEGTAWWERGETLRTACLLETPGWIDP